MAKKQRVLIPVLRTPTEKLAALNQFMAARNEAARLELLLKAQQKLRDEAEASLILAVGKNKEIIGELPVTTEEVPINKKATIGYVELINAVKAEDPEAGGIVELIAQAEIEKKEAEIKANPESKTRLVVGEPVSLRAVAVGGELIE